MADLQSNIENLSSKIQGSLVGHAEGIAMETNDATGAFHYNPAMEPIISPQTNGLPVGAQASQVSSGIHRGYDTASGQQVADGDYSRAPKRNDQLQDDSYDLSSDQTQSTVQNSFTPSAMETAEMYEAQGDPRNNEEYAANDSNMETYMTEQDHNQYSEYSPSEYQEEQYVNGNQFNVMAEQMENNQAISDVTGSNADSLH